MPPSRTWVVKLGGAMLHAPELAQWLAACSQPAAAGCVVVIGGGALADAVRALHARWRFGELLAHELALTAMAMNARVASALAPALQPFAWPGGVPRPPAIWLPAAPWTWLELPASWAVTADSIAFRLATVLDAEALVLVKSVPAAELAGDRATAYARRGVIDTELPRLMRAHALPVHVVSKHDGAAWAAARARGERAGGRVRG